MNTFIIIFLHFIGVSIITITGISVGVYLEHKWMRNHGYKLKNEFEAEKLSENTFNQNIN